MASQRTRTLNVVGRPNCHHAALGTREFRGMAHVGGAPAGQGTPSVVRAFLAFLAFMVCASVHQVALASAVGPSARADAVAACFAGDYALDRTAPASVHCPQHDAAPQLCELKVLGPQEPEGPEDSEGDALLDAPAISLAVSCAAMLPAASKGLRAAAATCTARFLVSSALARGPPSSTR